MGRTSSCPWCCECHTSQPTPAECATCKHTVCWVSVISWSQGFYYRMPIAMTCLQVCVCVRGNECSQLLFDHRNQVQTVLDHYKCGLHPGPSGHLHIALPYELCPACPPIPGSFHLDSDHPGCLAAR